MNYTKIENNQKKYRILSFIVILIVLAVWTTVSNMCEIPDVFLPKPQDVVKAFIKLSTEGYGTSRRLLFVHLAVSMKRLLLAFFISIITAVPLGFLNGSVKWVQAIINPFIEFYRSLPPLAYYTFLVLWMGISEESKVALLVLAGFPPIYIACVSGIQKVSVDLIRSSTMLGANRCQTFINVILPATLPDIMTGIRTAIGVEYTTLISAEMVAAKAGIGWMVFDASNWMKSDVVFVGIILMGFTGVLLNGIIIFLENRLIHWKGK